MYDIRADKDKNKASGRIIDLVEKLGKMKTDLLGEEGKTDLVNALKN